MIDMQVIEDPAAAAVALDPIRGRLLAELAEPVSAAALAARLGIARQKVNYHLHALERHQLVREAEKRTWGGLTERRMVSTAASYVMSPAAPGQVAADPARSANRLSASYLIALGARIVCEVGNLLRRSWESPHRFVADSRGEVGPDNPAVATEWIVEARSGGTCVVRVVHRWFASSDDWDDQFEGHTYGWLVFFRILRLSLTHFPGQPSAPFQLMAVAPEPKAEAWAALTRPLDLAELAIGERASTSDGAPPLAGVVESIGQGEWPELLLRLDEPAPGVAHFVPHAMMGQVYLTLRFYLYGDRAPTAVKRAGSMWQAWLNEHFPTAGEEGEAA